MDLKGKAPKATTLEEANKIIKALWDIIQQLNEAVNLAIKNMSEYCSHWIRSTMWYPVTQTMHVLVVAK